MRLSTSLLILVAGLALSALVWVATGGKFAFLFLPLMLPLMWRVRR